MKEDLFLRGGVWGEQFLSGSKSFAPDPHMGPIDSDTTRTTGSGEERKQRKRRGPKTSSHEGDIHTTHKILRQILFVSKF